MNKIVLHIDFNSYFATIEQQANPRLRGKPIGVTGGDRLQRTVLGAASVEAKKFGVKTGMQIWEAKKLCPNIIIVKGDADKYLDVTRRFLNILKDYSPYLEVFSIDEVFLQIPNSVILSGATPKAGGAKNISFGLRPQDDNSLDSRLLTLVTLAQEIKSRVRQEVGEWITVSIGISYNKLMAKLAGSLYKPDGLVAVADEQAAMMILEQIELDEICGIGPAIKKRLNNMGIFNFKKLRAVPLISLLASFKSYGQTLYHMARGIDHSPVVPFYEREEVQSVGHRHTLDHDTDSPVEIKQVLLKLTELVARRLRAKKLVGKTIHCWYREALYPEGVYLTHPKGELSRHLGDIFQGNGMQTTGPYTNDGLAIFKSAWRIFNHIWDQGKIRMIGVSVSNLNPLTPQNLTFLEDKKRQERIIQALDQINDKYGEFTLQRAALLSSPNISRKPNPYLADRRFRI